MVATNSNSISHPIRVNFFGQAGVEPNCVYTMTCKLIGTNDNQDDHLHFENSARIDLGDVARFGESFAEDLMDKTVMIALGYVTARETVKDPLYKGKSTVVISLQSQDYDPITKIPVTFYTKHYIPPVRNMEKAQNICQVGREVQLVGAIKDYDGDRFMWETEVTAISRCTGDAPSLIDKGVNKPGTPKGGRVPLTLQRNKASTIASTSASTLDAAPSSSPLAPLKPADNIENVVPDIEKDENTVDLETPNNSSPLKRRRN
ncbi:uncharacterized protein MELLADRAFT_87623 [Melampsora larici-populina 98AG31]|uniref:Uncharacterized protein n=1 Tax=Melampsora larici-populina (strain 98AG31 / pathotype 3-4-7) TaxID=747676 RepID=F4RP37_MELLP|nr:uncharacterized protein MELLADRAFT_87623 [Melampsora larici-populina 98AG31]EGG05751.1 hypothetical protein MELLADRAFT_87623 [Melampsora larici-populina 98AG31]